MLFGFQLSFLLLALCFSVILKRISKSFFFLPNVLQLSKLCIYIIYKWLTPFGVFLHYRSETILYTILFSSILKFYFFPFVWLRINWPYMFLILCSPMQLSFIKWEDIFSSLLIFSLLILKQKSSLNFNCIILVKSPCQFCFVEFFWGFCCGPFFCKMLPWSPGLWFLKVVFSKGVFRVYANLNLAPSAIPFTPRWLIYNLSPSEKLVVLHDILPVSCPLRAQDLCFTWTKDVLLVCNSAGVLAISYSRAFI